MIKFKKTHKPFKPPFKGGLIYAPFQGSKSPIKSHKPFKGRPHNASPGPTLQLIKP